MKLNIQTPAQLNPSASQTGSVWNGTASTSIVVPCKNINLSANPIFMLCLFQPVAALLAASTSWPWPHPPRWTGIQSPWRLWCESTGTPPSCGHYCTENEDWEIIRKEISKVVLPTCKHIAPPSFSGTPARNTDSANFSFITLCRFWSARSEEEVASAFPHSLARNVRTRCSPHPENVSSLNLGGGIEITKLGLTPFSPSL